VFKERFEIWGGGIGPREGMSKKLIRLTPSVGEREGGVEIGKKPGPEKVASVKRKGLKPSYDRKRRKPKRMYDEEGAWGRT